MIHQPKKLPVAIIHKLALIHGINTIHQEITNMQIKIDELLADLDSAMEEDNEGLLEWVTRETQSVRVAVQKITDYCIAG